MTAAILRWSSTILVVLLVAACGGAHRDANPSPSSASTTTDTDSGGEQVPISATTGLGAAGVALARAYLTGTGEDYYALQGPPCRSAVPDTPAVRKQANAELQQERVQYQRMMHINFATLKIRGVLARNVRKTSGEVEVLYDAPASKVGSYNWVGFQLYQGKWKVADCVRPIGGTGEDSAPEPAPSTTSP